MKHFFAALLFAASFLMACNNDKPKDEITITDKDGKQKATIKPDEIKTKGQEMLDRKEELQKLTPFTTDELTALVPAELMGVAHTNLKINNAMGTSVANADYKINDSADLKLEIVDCAGPGGAGMFGMQYLNMLDINSDDENEYVKTIEFNGGKAIENCRKKKNRCTIAFFSGDRFLVSLRGDNIGIDLLKDVVKGLKIK